MKYLCLVYQDETLAGTLTRSELDARACEVLAFRDELRKSGHYIDSAHLHSVDSATTIQVRNDRVLISDGPFATTKEHLEWYYLIEARDLNDAIRVASKMPPARLGSIEIRPIMDVPITGAFTAADAAAETGKGKDERHASQ